MFVYFRVQIVNVNLQNKPEWFLEKNPLGKAPVLEYNDQVSADWIIDFAAKDSYLKLIIQTASTTLVWMKYDEVYTVASLTINHVVSEQAYCHSINNYVDIVMFSHNCTCIYIFVSSVLSKVDSNQIYDIASVVYKLYILQVYNPDICHMTICAFVQLVNIINICHMTICTFVVCVGGGCLKYLS